MHVPKNDDLQSLIESYRDYVRYSVQLYSVVFNVVAIRVASLIRGELYMIVDVYSLSTAVTSTRKHCYVKQLLDLLQVLA